MTVAQIPPLFLNRFEVDSSAPFQRYLNRLEVEIAAEDYQELLRVERLWRPLTGPVCERMVDLTERLLMITQNQYNRQMLQQKGARIYLDREAYRVYFHLQNQWLCFVPVWREGILRRFLRYLPSSKTDWHSCQTELPGFECRYLPDEAGGTLLLRHRDGVSPDQPLLTAAHGPYDPHTFEVMLFFLRSGKASAAVVNLGYSGREPLTDTNVQRLRLWECPLNPSNLDVVFPYTDEEGLPYSYKTERHLGTFVRTLGMKPPPLIIDIHGCVGTGPEDQRLMVGLGGMPPFPVLEKLGELTRRGSVFHLKPQARLRQGLGLLRDLSDELYVQFCSSLSEGYQFFVLGRLQLLGRKVDLKREVGSLLDGEERSYLPDEHIRWLPGAGANALQRVEAGLIDPNIQCLHVEIPTFVRQKIRLHLKELAINESLDSSSL